MNEACFKQSDWDQQTDCPLLEDVVNDIEWMFGGCRMEEWHAAGLT